MVFQAHVSGSADPQVKWTVTNGMQTLPGLISGSGVLQPVTDCALLGATLTITASSVASPSAMGTATVSVVIGFVNPAKIAVPPNETLVFAATDLPCGVGPADLPATGYQWSILEGAAGGTLNGGLGGAAVTNGLMSYTSPSATGTYHLKVTLRDSTQSATITVAQPVPYAAAMKLCRSGHTATLLAGGAVLLVGGAGVSPSGFGVCPAPPPAPPEANPVATAEIYDPVAGTFTPTALPVYPEKSGHAATLLADGRVLLTGGITSCPPTCPGGTSSPHAEIYDPGSGQFMATPDMSHGHSFHAAAALGDGRVVVASNWGEASALELFSPSTGAFTPLTSLGTAVPPFATATLLDQGQVLIAGGGGGQGLSTANLLDSQAQFLVPTGAMNRGRLGHTATLLPSGKVLLVGGIEQEYLFQARQTGAIISQTAEIYDPSAGTFKVTTGPMLAPRAYHAAALLADGRVLIVGGVSQLPAQYDEFDPLHALAYYQWGISVYTTEIYDPATDSFSAGPVISARLSPTATTLANGHVLIAGGGPLQAELY